MKGRKSPIVMVIVTILAIVPSAIAAPKTTLKTAGRVTTTVVNTMLSGAKVPAKTVGINGDFYIDTKNLDLYGPKTNGVWKIATTLKQASTKSVSGDSGLNGIKGATGEKGEKGATGNTGATGSAGANGATGITGATGEKGSMGIAGAPGATGLSGAAGSIGAQGAKGDAGTAGTNGAQGAKGDAGTAGIAGSNGAQGAKGDTGTAGVSVSKFVSLPNISLITATDGNSNSGIFFTSDSDGNYTFDVLVTGGIQINVDYKLNAEIVVGSSALTSQYVVASDAVTFANGSAGRQYGFHIIGVASGVTLGTSFGVRISIQYGAGTSTVFFTGRALVNKVGSIG